MPWPGRAVTLERYTAELDMAERQGKRTYRIPTTVPPRTYRFLTRFLPVGVTGLEPLIPGRHLSL
jgi:hypothetical protein